MKVNDWEEGCPLLLTQRIILGKWKLSIIWFLAHNKVMRFSELKRAFNDSALTQKMLTQHLRELEDDNLVFRKSYNEVPPRVEYSLTEMGEKFIPVIQMMENWGKDYMKEAGMEIL
ncbi:winged helix-turn-helix transcriptional regulator [Clostridium fungisolvens]|uniref:HTH-type transcriptional activator HxlR n=1 Tax=Clostridium fungisolvens TaxID=1604897 RepID=A0A6V8SFM1_9CLOT|nr:helix-turn-helix domain-containing protein [Clostridium fungisolvens]GFP75516.1 HTH-type transcriptional activator HxlR [Clostridium fungisolvens]